MNMKRLLTALFLLCMAGIMQVNAYDFEAGRIYYNIIPGTNEVEVTYGNNHSYNDYDGEVIIPATVTYSGTTYSVTRIGDMAFYVCSDLISLHIPNSVTSIGYSAFFCCGLISLHIPDSVTSIGAGAFEGCRELVSINIPDRVTVLAYNVFSDCRKLTSIRIPDGVTIIGEGAFALCSSLTSITIPNSVTHIKDFSFTHCSILTSIRIPDSVTIIGRSAFSGCSSLTSLYIPAGITTLYYGAFEGCRSLTTVSIPGSVTYIEEHVFESCNDLKIIELGWNDWEFPELLYLVANNIFKGVDFNQCWLYVPAGTREHYAWWFTSFQFISESYLFTHDKSLSFESTVGTDSIRVRSGVAWTASSNADWVTLSPASGAGSEKLFVSVSANENSLPRFATITVSDEGMDNCIIEVTQNVAAPTDIPNPRKEAVNIALEENHLHVNSPVSEKVSIYSRTGILLYTYTKPAGDAILPIGNIHERVLIVRGSSGWARKIIN
jgi:hypothetical protein